jgi:hypothetical protein
MQRSSKLLLQTGNIPHGDVRAASGDPPEAGADAHISITISAQHETLEFHSRSISLV